MQTKSVVNWVQKWFKQMATNTKFPVWRLTYSEAKQNGSGGARWSGTSFKPSGYVVYVTRLDKRKILFSHAVFTVQRKHLLFSVRMQKTNI